MKKLIIVLLAAACGIEAQTNTVRLCDQQVSRTCLNISVGAAGPLRIPGLGATNGNIYLTPGNVSGSASVFIDAPRLDAPGLIVRDASGTTTGNALELRKADNSVYFRVVGGTDATAPGMVEAITSGSVDPRGLVSTEYNSSNFAATFQCRKAGGTPGSPAIVANNHTLCSYLVSAWDGSAWVYPAYMAVRAAVSGSDIGAQWRWAARTPGAGLNELLTLDHSGQLRLGNTADNSTGAIFQATGDISAGTGSSHTIIRGASGTSLFYSHVAPQISFSFDAGSSSAWWNNAYAKTYRMTAQNGGAIEGEGSVNGNIPLNPGNVSGNASVFISAPRLDQPGLIVRDASGTTTANSLEVRKNDDTVMLSVRGSTDASCPACLFASGRIIAGLASTDVSTGNGAIVTGDALVSATATSNASTGSFAAIASNYVALASSRTGSGTYLPLTLWTNNAERMRILTNGQHLFGMTSTDVSSGAGSLVSMDALVSATGSLNASLGSFAAIASNYVAVASSRTGSGTYLPLTLWTNGSERVRILTDGKTLVARTTDDGTGAIFQVNGNASISGALVVGGSITAQGSAGFTGTTTCPGGQHFNSITTVSGIFTGSYSCN
jgi:hypothetical protein